MKILAEGRTEMHEKLEKIYLDRYVLYRLYRNKEISKDQYLYHIQPLDEKVDRLEMSIFPDSFWNLGKKYE